MSYVLNDTPSQTISAGTRRRVLEAAERLGYQPFGPARALRTGKTEIVLFVIPDLPNGFAIGRLIGEMSRLLAARDLTLVTHVKREDSRPLTEIAQSLSPVALIWGTPPASEEVEQLRRAGIVVPFPFSEDGQGRTSHQHVVGHVQAEHLWQRGHRRLGYAWPTNPRLTFLAELRLDGVRGFCHDRGLPPPDVARVALDVESARAVIRRWRDGPEPVTGVCAFEDQEALAILAGLRRDGLTAPDDLAVIGVDDNPMSQLAAPPLSTVAFDLTIIARHLVAPLLAQLTSEDVGVLPPVPVWLVARDSS